MSDELKELLETLGSIATAIPVAREAANTVGVKVVPIVILPGIMGTRLKFDFDNTIWDPDDIPEMSINWLLNSASQITKRFGSGAVIVDADVDRGVGALVASFYKDFATNLRARLEKEPGVVCPVHACGYDWHQSNEASAKHLVTFVDKLIAFFGDLVPVKQVILVTHSMGGLVARAACAFDPVFAKRVLAVIHTGQPVHGSPQAYRFFLTGVNDSGKASKDKVLGNEWWKYTAFASAIRSVTQLLPTNNYVRDDLPGVPAPWLEHVHGEGTGAVQVPVNTTNIYAEYAKAAFPGIVYNYDASVSDFSPEEWLDIQKQLELRILQASTFHAALGTFVHPNTSIVTSTHAQTEVGLTGFTRDTAPFFRHVVHRGIGDQTVPRASANALAPREDGVVVKEPDVAKPRRRITGDVGDHSGMLKDPDVLDFVVNNVLYFVRKLGTASPLTSG